MSRRRRVLGKLFTPTDAIALSRRASVRAFAIKNCLSVAFAELRSSP
jgi:hypothetical protein